MYCEYFLLVCILTIHPLMVLLMSKRFKFYEVLFINLLFLGKCILCPLRKIIIYPKVE